jgi:hypothetical protein
MAAHNLRRSETMTGRWAKICRNALPLLVLLAAVAAHAQEMPDRAAPAIAMQQSAPTGERTYVVEPGDTLWSIAEGLYDEPWYWPSLWSYNPQITNPHLIYPGDLLYLSRKSSQTLAEKTISFAASRFEAKPKTGIELVRRVGYISSRDYRESGVLEASREERNMLGQLDEAYIRFNTRRCQEDDKAKAERDAFRASEEGETKRDDKKDEKKAEDEEDEALVGPCVRDGDKYTLYRVEREIIHPVTGKRVGYKINFLGDAKVLSTVRPLVSVLITRSHSEISRGDLLTNVFEPLQFVTPVPNKAQVAGVIVDFHHETTAAGAFSYVYIDKGADDGVEKGNRFEIVWRGDGLARGNVGNLKDYPDEQIGIALVVEAYDRHSLALLTSTVRELERGMPAIMAKGF